MTRRRVTELQETAPEVEAIVEEVVEVEPEIEEKVEVPVEEPPKKEPIVVEIPPVRLRHPRNIPKFASLK